MRKYTKTILKEMTPFLAGTLARFSGHRSQNFLGHMGVILKLRDVKMAIKNIFENDLEHSFFADINWSYLNT